MDVLVNDNGVAFKCAVVAGHIASRASVSKSSPLDASGVLDTLNPASHWFLYVKAEEPRE